MVPFHDDTHETNLRDGKFADYCASRELAAGGVLGANDGIVSVTAIIVGAASATSATATVAAAGCAALVGEAISMALGEYVSVSGQRDSELAIVTQKRAMPAENPARELERLANHCQHQGMSATSARSVAAELSQDDPLGAHLKVEFGLDEDDLLSP